MMLILSITRKIITRVANISFVLNALSGGSKYYEHNPFIFTHIGQYWFVS